MENQPPAPGQPVMAPQPAATPQAVPQPMPGQQTPSAPPPVNAPKKGPAKMIFIVLAVLLILGSAGVGAYLYLNQNNQPTPTTTPEPTIEPTQVPVATPSPTPAQTIEQQLQNIDKDLKDIDTNTASAESSLNEKAVDPSL
jgi:hypothetical protein